MTSSETITRPKPDIPETDAEPAREQSPSAAATADRLKDPLLAKYQPIGIQSVTAAAMCARRTITKRR